jgi:hypothetical protein
MSDVAQEPKTSLLQQFVQQRDLFVQQAAQLSNQWQQAQGAIFACNQMIAKIEEEIAYINKDNQGANVDGEINGEEKECLT